MTRILFMEGIEHHTSEGLDDLDNHDIEYYTKGKVGRILLFWDILRKKYDVVHFQYLQMWTNLMNSSILSPFYSLIFLINIWIIKKLGVSVIWTAHHPVAHESPSAMVDKFVRMVFLFFCDDVIVLHQEVADLLNDEFCMEVEPEIIHLGDFQEYHSNYYTDEPVANVNFVSSNLPKIGILGYLREYKRIPLGIKAFKNTTGKYLIVAGSPRSKQIEDEIRKARKGGNIGFDFRFLGHEDICHYMENLDVVLVLNDQNTVPGTIYLAASFCVPIVTVEGGTKEKIVEDYDIGYVSKLDEESIAENIEKATDSIKDFTKFNLDHSWSNYANQHNKIYSEHS